MSFTNKFGWSLSRESMFDECRRRYYFHYYFSWGGWESKAPQIVREAFKLKRLSSLPLWRGQLVHYVATKVLQSMRAKGRVPDKNDVMSYTLKRFQSQLDFSRQKKYLTEPKKRGGKLNIDWLALFEHEYERPLEPERIERTRKECTQAVNGLFDSPILDVIYGSDPSGWVIEDLDRAEFSQMFEFDGVTVFVKTDLMFRGNDGTFNIVDWKTNRGTGQDDAGNEESGNAALQLGIYGYYAVNVRKEPLDSIRLYEVNLLRGGEVSEHPVDGKSLELFHDHIREGISRLTLVLVDGDRDRNEPLYPEHFPKIENGLCRYCNFYRVCKDESYPAGLA